MKKKITKVASIVCALGILGYLNPMCSRAPLPTSNAQLCWDSYKAKYPNATANNSPQAWDACFANPAIGTTSK